MAVPSLFFALCFIITSLSPPPSLVLLRTLSCSSFLSNPFSISVNPLPSRGSTLGPMRSASLSSFASSAPRNMVFFSVSKEEKKNLLYSYNGGGHELQALALNWLGQAKPYHSWHSHTADNMTFGFLMHGGYTFFAIDNAGSSEMLLFLERLRDAFEAAPKNDRVEGELSWVVRIGAEKACTEERKPKDIYGGGGGGESKVDVLQEDAGGVVSSGRSSSSVLKAQQCARRLWWRHAKTVAAVDVLLCLAMFAVWLVVCEGLQCVGRR